MNEKRTPHRALDGKKEDQMYAISSFNEMDEERSRNTHTMKVDEDERD